MSNIVMGVEEIIKYLPHRPPFLLIDRVTALDPSKSIVAIKNVTINEPFFQGHFPGQPIMPGVLILEALAQASTVLAFFSTNENPLESKALYVFAGIDNVRFKRIVKPGDQLHLSIEVIKIRTSVWKVKGTASVDGEVVCVAELMSAKKEGKEEE